MLLKNAENFMHRLVPMIVITGAVAGALVMNAPIGAAQAPKPAAKQDLPQVVEEEPLQEQEEGGYTVATGDVVNMIIVSGELQAARSREISVPRIRSAFGTTITFLADEGKAVKAGEPLVEYDASELISQKTEAERKLDEAILKIEKTKADLGSQRSDLLNSVAQAEGNLEIARLYGKIPEELLPANDYQRYQVNLEQATLALDKAKERLANLDDGMPAQIDLVEIEKSQAELDLRKIEADIKIMQVRAPQDGIVIYGDNWRENRKVQIGDQTFPGMTVITLPDLSTMEITGYVYDTELRYLSHHMPCSFGLDAVPGRVWTGKIVSLTSVAGRKGFASDHKVFKAVVQVDQQDLAVMRPGMTARVEIPVTMASDVLAVPRDYIGLDASGRYFVVKGDGNPENNSIQNIEVGVHGERLVEVLAGVDIGEKLVPIKKASEISQ
jgi:multidrug efflux pump subunit AcrA (membrane-fusion protein)